MQAIERKTHTTYKHTHTQNGQNNIEKRDNYIALIDLK